MGLSSLLVMQPELHKCLLLTRQGKSDKIIGLLHHQLNTLLHQLQIIKLIQLRPTLLRCPHMVSERAFTRACTVYDPDV